MTADRPLRLLILGAHPDDAEYHVGGLAVLYRQAGHEVKMVSLTDGSAGHHLRPGPELVARRRAEAAASAAVIGATYDVFDIPDGQLFPTLENRLKVIRLIRTYQPDLILTHRPNDYHPDHRYTSTLVQDACYMVTVPAVAPDTPHLMRDPVICYMPDHFRKPYPLDPRVVVDVGPVLTTVARMWHQHTSQFYEWLAYNMGIADQVPADDGGRLAWITSRVEQRQAPYADRFRDLLEKFYGPERGRAIRFVEAFEPCEYGAPLTPEAFRRLFAFLYPPDAPARQGPPI